MSGSEAPAAPGARRRRAGAALALLGLIGAALALAHGEIWRAGATQHVPLGTLGSPVSLHPLASADLTYATWLVSRHAHTLWTRPWRLFDTEHCAPDEHTLTYGVPMIAMGLFGMPAALVSNEPLLVYNAALLVWSAVAALAMYALVTSWTGRHAAGLAAALLFAFHPIRLDHIMHPGEWDIAATALALYFAERLFARGRWRDAVGLALAGALQVATSFYTLLAATLLALPLGPWLWLRRAPREARLVQLALALAGVALVAALVLGPYLGAREAERIGARSLFYFAPWSEYAPGGALFAGWPLVLFALLGLCAPRRLGLARVEGDPRAALCAGALLVAFIAAGPTSAQSLQAIGLPVPAFDPYAALARYVPGLDSVRVVTRLATAVHLVVCVLAGAGVAAAIGWAGRYASAAGAALVTLVALACFGAPLPGPLRWQLEAIRPSQSSIDFFAELAAEGDQGPLLELPLDAVNGQPTIASTQRILLSAWHGRRTSACFGSFVNPGSRKIAEVLGGPPGREMLLALRELGFTTVVVHTQGASYASVLTRPYDRAAAEPDPALRSLRHGDSMSAYQILPASAAGAGEAQPE